MKERFKITNVTTRNSTDLPLDYKSSTFCVTKEQNVFTEFIHITLYHKIDNCFTSFKESKILFCILRRGIVVGHAGYKTSLSGGSRRDSQGPLVDSEINDRLKNPGSVTDLIWMPFCSCYANLLDLKVSSKASVLVYLNIGFKVVASTASSIILLLLCLSICSIIPHKTAIRLSNYFMRGNRNR